MTGPRSGSYDQTVYAAGGLVQPTPQPPRPPAFHRGVAPTPARQPRRTPPAVAAINWLTVVEVAASMRVSKMTVYRLIHGGELSAARIGRSFRVDERALNAYLRSAEFDVDDDTYSSPPREA